MNLKRLLKQTLLVVALLGVGTSAAWADDVASHNFNGQSTPFTIYDAARLSASYTLQTGSETDYFVKYSCGNMNAVAFAYYDFSSSVSDAATVSLEFDFLISQVSGHVLISVADASVHTASSAGFTGKSNTGYGSNGAIFNLGCYRSSGNDKFAINSSQTNYDALGAWCHASIVVDNGKKTVNYVITKGDDELASATNVSFLNASANRCSQIDLYIGTNASGNAIQIDNLTITKTVSDVNHNYTINALVGTTKLQELATGSAKENSSYSVSVPKVIVKDDKYYVLNSGQNNMTHCLAEYTMGTADETKAIYYTEDPSIIYFKEAESIQQSTAFPTASNGFTCNYYATPQIITITEAGVYQLETNVTGRDSNSSLDLYTADGTTAVGSFAKNCGLGVKTLNFVATDNMRVGGPYYNDKFNNSKSVDYILVRKLCGITNADAIVGNVNNNTEYLADMTEKVTLKPGDSYRYQFVNHNGHASNWNNWVLPVYNSSDENKIVVRADNYEDKGAANTGCTSDFDWTNFVSEMDGATVDMTVSFTADKVFTMSAAITTASGEDWTYSYTSDYTGSTFDFTGDDYIKVALSVNLSWAEVLSEGMAAIGSKITAAGWATLYTPYALDFSGVEGLEAYTAACADNKVTLTKVDDVPANSGVVLKGAASTYSIPVIASSTTDKGELTGSATAATAWNAYDGYNLYMLALNANSEAQFTKVTSGSIAAGKAFLKLSNTIDSRSLTVVVGDDATGISDATRLTDNGEGIKDNVYNLKGQRVSQPTKGLYIMNGKKILVK